MRSKKLFSFIIVMVLALGVGTSAFASLVTLTVPYLGYTAQNTLYTSDMVTYVYNNKTESTQSVNFNITNKDLTDTSTNLVVNKFSGFYLVHYADGTEIRLGNLGGYVISGGLGNLPPGASLVVNLKAADGIDRVDYKIKFDSN